MNCTLKRFYGDSSQTEKKCRRRMVRTSCIIVLKNSVKASRLDDGETAFARNRYYTVEIRGDSRKLRVHVARY